MVNKLLRSNIAIEYLCSKNKHIDNTYKHHFIQNNKTFNLMNKTESFINSTLMYMWH